MKNATGPLQTNDYKLVNVGTGTCVAIRGNGGGMSIHGSIDPDVSSTQWHAQKRNNYYVITNRDYGLHGVWTISGPEDGDAVVTSSGSRYQWTIKESSTPGKYLIYPLDNDTVVWSLATDTDVVRMSVTASNDNSLWYFQHL